MKMSEYANHWFVKKLRELLVGCVGVLGTWFLFKL